MDSVIAERDRYVVEQLQEKAAKVDETVTQLEDIMHNVSKTLDHLKKDMSYRIMFHNFYGIRVIKRAVVYGFVQAWDIEQQSTFEPLSSGTREFMRNYKKTLLYIINATNEDLSFQKMLAWTLETELSTRKELITRASKAMRKVHNAFLNGDTLIDYQWGIHQMYDSLFVPKNLLRHREGYQQILFNDMDITLTSMEKEIISLKHHMKQAIKNKAFNETFFQVTKKRYLSLIENFNYVYNLFKDAIVHRTKVLVESKETSFKKKNETLFKEMSDTMITIRQSLDLVSNMRKNVWVDISRVINMSIKYVDTYSSRKSDLAQELLSDQIDYKLQQMHIFFNDVRARARNFDHDWKKFMGAYIKVWVAIKGEGTTTLFYQQLYKDLIGLKEDPKNNVSVILKRVFSDKKQLSKLGTNDPDVLLRRSNADLAIINITEHISYLKEYFLRILHESNIALVVNERDDDFFEAMGSWTTSLRTFMQESKTDESFFR